MRVKGKRAIVTGGASGLGEAIAKRLLSEGAKVVISDIDADRGEAVAGAADGSASFVGIDVGDEQSWRHGIAGGLEWLGGLDVLVNAAGINVVGSIADTSVDDWNRVMQVNATSVLIGCKLATEEMRDGGSIINIASVAGLRASSAFLPYSASKAVVLMITESTALYCAEQGLDVRCNAICPGIIDTPILEPYYDVYGGRDAALKSLGAMVPAGRLGTPDDVAATALFLASDEAAYVTGAAFKVDGALALKS